MKPIRQTLIVLAMASIALTYLSYYAMAYDGYANAFLGMAFFGSASIVILSILLAESIERRGKS